jgi:hypothetical protein
VRRPAEVTHHPLSVGLLLGGAQPGGPLLLDTAELPHGQGSSPRGEEQADDDEADGVQVQAADPVPERAAQAGLVGEQAERRSAACCNSLPRSGR